MVPTQLTRRRAIAAGSVACVTGLAGCLDGVLGNSDGSASYADWLGTTMADREWPTDETTADGGGSNSIYTAFGLDPSAIAADPLADAFGDLRAQSQIVGERTPAINLDPNDVTLDFVSLEGDFRVRVGSFGSNGIVSGLPENANERGSHRDATIYTSEASDGANGATSETWQGYGVADGLLVVALGAPDASTAAEYVESILDVGRGNATKLRAANEGFDRLAAALGDGFFVEATLTVESGSEGISLRRDGDVIDRRAAAVMPSESQAEGVADQFETTLGEQANATAAGERTRENQASVYGNTAITRDGRLVVFEATIPIADADPIDTTFMWT